MSEKPLLGPRAQWTEVMMSVAGAIAERSRDATTRVGAVICSPKWRVLGTGYNGPPAGSSATIPMAGAGRHLFVLHAEENALYQAIAATGQWPLQHAMAFVTHRPCSRCVVRLFHNGVGLVTYLHDQLDDQQRRDTELAQEELGIEIVRYGS